MSNYSNDYDDDLDDDSEEDIIISKSQQKREAEEAQKLGEDLLKLDVKSQKSINLPEDLSKALDDARRIKAHGALKRQLQYIGKIMRKVDLEPIRAEYEKIQNHYVKDIKHLHLLETWRDRLLDEGDKALEELIDNVPHIDRQHLRQLIRQAAKEKKFNKPPKSAREIFQYLKIIFTQPEI
jgi:ribosome-associated protein